MDATNEMHAILTDRMSITLPPCRWRGYITPDGSLCECRSPKLITPQGYVPVNACDGSAWPGGVCKYLDHEPDLTAPLPGKTTGPAPAAAPPAPVDPEQFACVHRGPVLETRLCDLCGVRGQPFEVYQCGKHGECSIGRKHSKVQPCISCNDRLVIPPRISNPAPAPSCDTILKDSRGRYAPSWHNLYRGGTAFLLGGGPSLTTMDLTPLRQPGILTAAMNNIATLFRPNLWFCVDVPSRFHEVILRDPGIAKFIKDKQAAERVWTWDAEESQHSKTKLEVRECPNVWFYQHAKNLDAEQFLIQPYPTWGPKGTQSVMLVALRMLFWMGIRRIYLLGCDFKMKSARPYAFDEGVKDSHLHHNNSKYKVLDGFFKQLLPYCELYGLQVFNCTPGSKLTAFPRVPYEAAVADALSGLPDEIVTRGMYRDE